MRETPKPTLGWLKFCEATAAMTDQQVADELGNVHSATVNRWRRALRIPEYPSRKLIKKRFRRIHVDDWDIAVGAAA